VINLREFHKMLCPILGCARQYMIVQKLKLLQSLTCLIFSQHTGNCAFPYKTRLKIYQLYPAKVAFKQKNVMWDLRQLGIEISVSFNVRFCSFVHEYKYFRKCSCSPF
jgi:hypothetical protein